MCTQAESTYILGRNNVADNQTKALDSLRHIALTKDEFWMDVSYLRDIHQKCVAYLDVQFALECLANDNRIEGLSSCFVQIRCFIFFPECEEAICYTEDVYFRCPRLRLWDDNCSIQQNRLHHILPI